MHLAGAMGIDTILLNHHQSCWRYTLTDKHTPWYGKNLFIVRQQIEGNWQSVFEELKVYVNGK